MSGAIGDEVKQTLSNLFVKLNQRVESHLSKKTDAVVATNEQMSALMTKACSLWVCYELQCSLSDTSQTSPSDTDESTKHISQLVSSRGATSSNLEHVWTWVGKCILPALVSARKGDKGLSGAMLPALFGTVMGVLGDYMLVCEAGSDTESILSALKQWMELLTGLNNDSLLMSTANAMMMPTQTVLLYIQQRDLDSASRRPLFETVCVGCSEVSSVCHGPVCCIRPQGVCRHCW